MTSQIGLVLFKHYETEEFIGGGMIFDQAQPHNDDTCCCIGCSNSAIHNKEIHVSSVSPFGMAIVYQKVENFPKIQVRFCDECTLEIGTKLTMNPSLRESVLAHCTFTYDRDI